MKQKKLVEHLTAKWSVPYWRYGLYLVLSYLAVYSVLAQPGVIGFRHDWAVPYDNYGGAFYFEQFVRFWRPVALGQNPVYPTDFWFNLLLGVLGWLGLSGPAIAKGLVWVSLAVSSISMDVLLTRLGYAIRAVLGGALFYMFTPVLVNKMAAGHTYYTLAFAFAPLVVATFLWAARRHDYWGFIPTGVLLALCGLQIQFMPMLGLVLALLAVFAPWDVRRKMLIGLPLVAGTAALFHLPWLVQMLNITTVAKTAAGASSFAWLEHQSTDLGTSVRMLGYHGGGEPFSKNLTNGTLWHPVSYAILILTGVSGLINWRQPEVRAAVVVSVLGVILSSGTMSPVGGAVRWLFENVKAINIFREFYHLTFLTALGYAVLLAALGDRIDRWRPNWRVSLATLLVVILYGTPVLTGIYRAVLPVVPRLASGGEIQATLRSDGSDSRVLWTPLAQPIRHPEAPLPGIDPEIKGSARPALPQELVGGRGLATEAYLLNLYATLLNGQTRDFSAFLDLAGVKHVVHRPALSSEYPGFTFMGRYPLLMGQWDQSGLKATLDDTPNLESVLTVSGSTIYEHDQWLPKVYLETNPVLAAGGFGALPDMTSLPLGGSRGTVLGLQTRATTGHLVTTNDLWYDLVQSFVDPSYKIEPGWFTRIHDDAAKGWIPSGRWWWYSPGLASIPLEASFTLAAGASHPFEVEREPGRYTLLVRALHGPEGGEIAFNWGEQTARLQTRAVTTGYQWTNLGDLEAVTEPLTMLNISGEQVVAQIILVPQDHWQVAESEARKAARQRGLTVLLESDRLTSMPMEVPLDESWLGTLDLARYKPYLLEDGRMLIEASYRPQGDDYGVLRKSLNVDLQDYPHLSITYAVIQPDFSTLQVGFELDVNGDGKQDQLVWGDPLMFEEPAPDSPRPWRIDLLKAARQAVPDASTYHLVGLQLLPHKRWGVEAPPQRSYGFLLEGVEFLPRKGLAVVEKDQDLLPGELGVPIDGQYEVYVRAHSTRPTDLVVSVGVVEARGQVETTSEWTRVGSVTLDKGTHEVKIATAEAPVSLVGMALVSQGEQPHDPIEISSRPRGVDQYEVTLATPSNGGELLVLTEGFDPGWVAEVDGKAVSPVLTNGYANGFILPEGVTSVIIGYHPQLWYQIGLIMGWCTILSLVGVWVFVAYRSNTAGRSATRGS